MLHSTKRDNSQLLAELVDDAKEAGLFTEPVRKGFVNDYLLALEKFDALRKLRYQRSGESVGEAKTKEVLEKAIQIVWDSLDNAELSGKGYCNSIEAAIRNLIVVDVNETQNINGKLVAEVDEDGENRPLRYFLLQYGGNTSHSVPSMRDHMKRCGYPGFWPEWAEKYEGHLTKAGAQLWIKFLISLEAE